MEELGPVSEPASNLTAAISSTKQPLPFSHVFSAFVDQADYMAAIDKRRWCQL